MPFELLAKVARAHQRMVLGVAWAPSDVLFATASRDCSVKLWAMTSSGDVEHLLSVFCRSDPLTPNLSCCQIEEVCSER